MPQAREVKLETTFATAKELAARGVGKYHLKKMAESGAVSKLKRGLYQMNETDVPWHYWSELFAVVPSGVLCLFSAWHFYDLSTYVPHQYHVAVEKNIRMVLLEYPPIKLYRWQAKTFEIGISEAVDSGVRIRIYDLEKSVCDAVKFRNKVGLDTMLEVLKNYAAMRSKNIGKLMNYARLLRIENIIKPYLQPLL